MSRFRDTDPGYGPADVTIFEEAFEHACRKLGLDPYPSDDMHYKRLRDEIPRLARSAFVSACEL